MKAKKATEQVTVEMLGTERARHEHGTTIWRVTAAENKALIVHIHSAELRELVNRGAWFGIECGNKTRRVASQDFGEALAVARRLLGVSQ